MTSTASSTDTRQGRATEEQRPSWQHRLRRFGYSAGPRSDVRDRLVPPYAEPGARFWAAIGVRRETGDRLARWSGWGGPLLVTLLAGVLRFCMIGSGVPGMRRGGRPAGHGERSSVGGGLVRLC
ncbi:hypothetical protein ABZS63_31200, partial [Streptomyces sp. NPDC005568]